MSPNREEYVPQESSHEDTQDVEDVKANNVFRSSIEYW